MRDCALCLYRGRTWCLNAERRARARWRVCGNKYRKREKVFWDRGEARARGNGGASLVLWVRHSA